MGGGEGGRLSPFEPLAASGGVCASRPDRRAVRRRRSSSWVSLQALAHHKLSGTSRKSKSINTGWEKVRMMKLLFCLVSFLFFIRRIKKNMLGQETPWVSVDYYVLPHGAAEICTPLIHQEIPILCVFFFVLIHVLKR